MRHEHGRPGKPKLQRQKRAFAPPAAASEKTGDRIAKVIARAGLCSRRDAEAWIAAGRVAVNGAVLTSPAINVEPQDKIEVDGKPLAQRQRTRLFLFHKPRGLVTTNKDPEGRPTVFDYLAERHAEAPRLVSIGRLDINTEGLLLLTNDGGLARVLELPATGWLRRYRVRANGATDQAQLDTLKQGLTLDGIHYAGIEAVLDRVQGSNVWLTMSLREGKNREIKRVLEHLGLAVNRLIRLSYGPFQLGELETGGLEETRSRVLRDQLGETLLSQSGADLDAPIEAEPERAEKRPARKPAAATRGPAPRGKIRARRPQQDAEPEKPRHRPLPGPRKHVSALRAQMEDSPRGPRQRIERGTTEDRKGRAVAIERHVAAAPNKKPRKPVRPKARPDTRQDSRQDSRQETRPNARPNKRPNARQEAHPNARQEARPNARQEARPNARQEARPNARQEARPNARQEARPNARQEARPNARQEARPNARQGARPNARPEARSGAKRPHKPARPNGGPRRPGAR
jgi:23S rRNA pseudouridine2605 synthase